MKKNFKAKNAFTLGEILITLTIIGVLAVLAIPTLLHDANEQRYVTGFLNAYSLLRQATNEVMMDNGGTMLGISADDSHIPVKDLYCNQLSCIRECDGALSGDGTAGNCFPASYETLNGGTYDIDADDFPGAILSNGMTIVFRHTQADCSDALGSCGLIMADINGMGTPNILGRDIFVFLYTENGIVPCGTDDHGDWSANSSCSPGVANTVNGQGCGARIVSDGNQMNY